jgi:hypothetical protein
MDWHCCNLSNGVIVFDFFIYCFVVYCLNQKDLIRSCQYASTCHTSGKYEHDILGVVTAAETEYHPIPQLMKGVSRAKNRKKEGFAGDISTVVRVQISPSPFLLSRLLSLTACTHDFFRAFDQ